MSELTRDIVRKSPQIVNPLKQRELSLRGMHLTQLPVTDCQLWTDIVVNFDSLDLSDNLLQLLDAPHLLTATEMQDRVTSKKQDSKSSRNDEVDDFLSFLLADNSSVPSQATTANNSTAAAKTSAASSSKLAPLKIRLSTIILHNNRLVGISKSFASQFRLCLKSLVLNGNAISDFSACEVFGQFEVLERLSLFRNPVQDRQFYRLFIIGTCSKTLKLLDFNKVRDQERIDAVEYKRQQREEEQNNNNNGNSTSASIDLLNGPKIGAGRRAARKAAAAANDKRDRNATEEQITGSAGAVSISTSVGHVVAVAGKTTNQPQDQSNDNGGGKFNSNKKYTREELMAMLDDPDLSLEDMDKIEEMMKDL